MIIEKSLDKFLLSMLINEYNTREVVRALERLSQADDNVKLLPHLLSSVNSLALFKSGVIQNQMGYDVRMGDCFIFINRTRTTMKILHAEDGGLVLYMKRLEEGTFRLPGYDKESRSYPMSWTDLVMMVEGIRDDPNNRLKRLKALRNHR